jgi:hypothetical protein
MRGQLLISLVDDDGFGGDYLNIYINGAIRKRIYHNTYVLYSLPIYLGDVVRMEFVNLSPITLSYLDLVRRDYTTDDEAGNRGIVDTSIASGVPFTDFTFTATTVASAYDFEYRMTNNLIIQYQILTEDYNPIMTENNDYINQQY